MKGFGVHTCMWTMNWAEAGRREGDRGRPRDTASISSRLRC